MLQLLVHGQRYAFKNYTTHDGLVQTDITDIKQDKKGNIWIGTNGGISIFDGKKFTNYDDHDLLQSLRINALLCDEKGTMWIATRNGLLKYDHDFEVAFKPNPSHNNFVTCLTSNSQNLLLFVCNGEVFQVNNGSIKKYPLKDLRKNIMFVAFDRDDNLWMVTDDLTIYRKTGQQITRIRTPFTESERQSGLGMIRILGKEGPVPYFVTNFSTYWVKDDSLHYFVEQQPQYRKARIGAAVYILEQDDSTMWVGGTVGLSKLTGNRFNRFTKDNGFCNNSVSCLFTDRENNLWVGCTYNGVYKLSNEALFHLQPDDESIDLRHVSAMAPLSANTALLATWGKGLYFFNGDSVSPILFPHPFIRYITGLLSFNGRTYISWFGNGVWEMNNQTFAMRMLPAFSKEAVGQLCKIAGGFLVTTLRGMCYVTDENFAIKRSVQLPDSYTITVLKDKIYQVSPFGQVNQLDDQLRVTRQNLFPEISSRVTQLTCYRDQFLVGTFGQGLFLYDAGGKLLRRLDKKSGLNTNIVTSLLVDGPRLFIGSNLGMIRADLPDFKNIKTFQESEGMFNWECRNEGLQKLSNGAILIATTNGPYVYYPAEDQATQHTSAVLSVACFNYGDDVKNRLHFSALQNKISLSEPIAFHHNQVAITLKGVSQRNPGGIVYHYQLEGKDSAWSNTRNPVIKFNNLLPGNYQFKAFARVGDYTSPPITLNFTIKKPLSGELWFQVLLIVFLSVMCFLLLMVGNRIYQKYIQARMMNKLETEVSAKQRLTTASLSFAQQHYKGLTDVLPAASKEKQMEELMPVFLKDVAKRIEWLWKKDMITTQEFHQYFDELLAEYKPGSKVYHTVAAEESLLPMKAAFPLLQVFSLYLFVGLYENGVAVFSLNSENKSNGQLLLRFYKMNRDHAAARLSNYHFLKDAIEQQRSANVTIDIIENLEYGNLLIAELNLKNENQL
ncbi:MAG TPA: two-component regulator propeller domain-containing protein [Flavisolibacter sp.]|nr:two-component regulator propeller domain-containing protein [Flavisolibacter sp.]